MSVIAFCIMRQTLFAAEVLLCEYAFMRGYERRKRFILRAVLSVLAVMIVAVGFGHIMFYTISELGKQYYAVVGCIGYLLVFSASVCGYFACYRIGARQLAFCAVSGYCMRQLIFCCYIFLNTSVGRPRGYISAYTPPFMRRASSYSFAPSCAAATIMRAYRCLSRSPWCSWSTS